MSESFTNNAATGAANYPSSGTGATNSAGQSTLQFIYDASTNSYSVTTAGKSQSFSPGDKDASTSNAQITVYKKVNGQTTDTLTLTNPGTSGSLTYKYVGSGFWQRTVASSSATSGTFDAFTYGVETPDAALRRTGAATYTVDLLGVKSYQDALVSLRGSGTLDADFTLAKITTSGSINEYDQNGVVSPSGGWNGSADLSSTANSFSGPFTLNGSGNGTFAGRFYGPNTDEVGAAWYSVDAANGLAALGTLVGRYSKDIPTKDTNSTLLNIKYDTSFAAEGAYTDYLHQPGADTLIFAPLSSSYRNPVPFSYKVDTQTYTLTGLNLTAPSQFGPSQLSSALSDSKWTVYQDSNSYGSAMLKLYKATGWDTSLALSYTGFGQWTLASKNAQGQDETYQQWFFYGLPRSQSGGGQVAVPTTGTATYNGSIFGIGTKGPGSNVADISGTANLAVNFGSQTFAGSMSPVATDRVTNAVVQLPTYSFSNGQLLAEQFTAGISVTNGPGSFNVGNLQGYFFGPQAQEIGATFSTTHAGDVNSDYSLQGIIVGKKP